MEDCEITDDSTQRALSRNFREERMRDDADNSGDKIAMTTRRKTSKGIVNTSKNCCTNKSSTRDNAYSGSSPVPVGKLFLNNERNRDKENSAREHVYVNSKPRSIQNARNESRRMPEHQETSRHEPDELSGHQGNDAPTSLCADSKVNNTSRIKQKIPRPANAFMLFANEWRKKLAAENPRESNKDISVRLGVLWKNMAKDAKEKYFGLARKVDAEHKRKYPDYVYNPKEARLRKAMREQNRELSRRSIIQNAIANANARMSGMGSSSMSASVAGDFVDHHHHHRFGCVTAAAISSTPTNVLDPHLAAMHRSKAVHPARLGGPDWYGNIEADPIERLQTMGMIHQRNFDKSAKDAIRNQVTATAAAAAECATAFSTGSYSTDFVPRSREVRHQEGEYSPTEFSDQKWHTFQNGASPDAHVRTPHPQSQIPGILHAGTQNPNPHAHGHGIWGQFCHGALPHGPAMPHNVAYRGPRHAVFLRDRLPNRHSGFPDEALRLPYPQSKHDVDNVRSPYPPTEHEAPQMLVPNLESMIRREIGDRPKWEHNTANSAVSLDSLAPSSTQQEPSQKREKDREGARRSSEKHEAAKKRSNCRTPLPGFHQAFGSTEIGRFSRSEFFVNMVGETGSGGEDAASINDAASAAVVERSDVSRHRTLNAGESVAANSTTINSAVAATATSTAANMPAAVSRAYEADEANPTNAYGEHRSDAGTSISSYRGQPSAPRWHSPHVGAIGSEI